MINEVEFVCTDDLCRVCSKLMEDKCLANGCDKLILICGQGIRCVLAAKFKFRTDLPKKD